MMEMDIEMMMEMDLEMKMEIDKESMMDIYMDIWIYIETEREMKKKIMNVMKTVKTNIFFGKFLFNVMRTKRVWNIITSLKS